MTMDDAFDARLKAAFASAAEPLNEPTEAERFSHEIVGKLSSPNRKRALILGGAGSTGSAVAGSQLEGILGAVQMPTEGAIGAVAVFMSPEGIAAAAMAVTIGAVAMILPRRIM